jgi:hypothetical protein
MEDKQPLNEIRLFLNDENETASLATQFASRLTATDSATETASSGGHIYLRGDLGAGKTSFASAGESKAQAMRCLNLIKFLTYTSIILIFIDLATQENGLTQAFAIFFRKMPLF